MKCLGDLGGLGALGGFRGFGWGVGLRALELLDTLVLGLRCNGAEFSPRSGTRPGEAEKKGPLYNAETGLLLRNVA